MAEQHINPIHSSDTEKRSWFALYTRPRHEMRVEKELQRLCIQAYLPCKEVIRQWSDRRKKLIVPIFPCYLFVHVNPKERIRSLGPPGVIKMLCFGGRPSRIPDAQIEAVRRVLEGGHDPIPAPYLKQGVAVEIISGPLLGLHGFIQRQHNTCRFIVSIEGICQSISVQIDGACLAPVDARN